MLRLSKRIILGVNLWISEITGNSFMNLSSIPLGDDPSGENWRNFLNGSPSDEAVQPGDILCDRYEVRNEIGRGGMGVVYAAHDRSRDQSVAIKILSPELFSNQQARAQFRQEARISSDLNHPNIVNVYDLQKDGELMFLTMELLDGKTLREEMRERKKSGGKFSVQEASEIVLKLCDALDYAHHFTVHRDVKPENVWLGSDGSLRLMDFGLAALLLDNERSRIGLSRSGMSLGTPYYMAPELLRGNGGSDGGADQYSLAVLFYELLTGEVVAGMSRPANDIRQDLKDKTSRVISRGLSTDPKDRYPSIGAFATAIRAGGDPIAWMPKTSSQIVSAVAAVSMLTVVIILLSQATFSQWNKYVKERKSAQSQSQSNAKIASSAHDKVNRRFETFEEQFSVSHPDVVRSIRKAGLHGILSELNNGHGLMDDKEYRHASDAFKIVLESAAELETRIDFAQRAIEIENLVNQRLSVLAEGEADPSASQKPGDLSLSRDSQSISQALKKERASEDKSDVYSQPLGSWGKRFRRSKDLLATGNFAETFGNFQELNNEITEYLERSVAPAKADAHSEQEKWFGLFPREMLIPKLDFVAQPRVLMAEAEQALSEDDPLSAVEAYRATTDVYSGWTKSVHELSKRTDRFLKEVDGIAEMRTNSLGMRFIRVTDHLWVSIWETRVMDYGVFLEQSARERIFPDSDWWKDLESTHRGPSHPVTGVSFEDAVHFTRWLTNFESSKFGFESGLWYDLMTNADFDEIVHRVNLSKGYTPMDYLRGVWAWDHRWNVIKGKGVTYRSDPAIDRQAAIQAAASRSPNAIGLFDFDGNTWEWLKDLYDYGRLSPVDGIRNLKTFAGGGKFGLLHATATLDLNPGYVSVGVKEAIGFRIVIRKLP